MTYIVCTLDGRFDNGKQWRSGLAVHLSGLLGDHFRVVVVIQEVVASRISCRSVRTMRSMHAAARQLLYTCVLFSIVYIVRSTEHNNERSCEAADGKQRDLLSTTALALCARRWSNINYSCKQRSTRTTGAAEQVDADMACLTHEKALARALAYTRIKISQANCQNNTGCPQPLTRDSAHIDEG